ncbi:MAG TPA: phosphoglycerate mutase family protein [Vicinamibacterales bacterium]
MSRTARVIVALLIAAAIAPRAGGQEAIYLVRHAERTSTAADSPLSAAGQARARRLATSLRDAGITKIFTTDLRRTIQTAAPLAKTINLRPTVIAASDTAALIASVHAASLHDRLLIVGHSNTVPDVLRALGVNPEITIADTEFDNLFIVIPRGDAPPMMLRLRY